MATLMTLDEAIKHYEEVAAHFNEPTSFSSDGWLRISEEDEVIAWMPLPKPYQSND